MCVSVNVYVCKRVGVSLCENITLERERVCECERVRERTEPASSGRASGTQLMGVRRWEPLKTRAHSGVLSFESTASLFLSSAVGRPEEAARSRQV